MQVFKLSSAHISATSSIYGNRYYTKRASSGGVTGALAGAPRPLGRIFRTHDIFKRSLIYPPILTKKRFWKKKTFEAQCPETFKSEVNKRENKILSGQNRSGLSNVRVTGPAGPARCHTRSTHSYSHSACHTRSRPHRRVTVTYTIITCIVVCLRETKARVWCQFTSNLTSRADISIP